ncbi:S-adenosylmethionine:tRNA ribosyltransferase-isomerase [Candidatus Magnetomoraceae bacterium gMMP-1]
MFSIKDYSYKLPEKLIAQVPASQRSASRLLCIDRKTGSISYNFFSDLQNLLKPSDVLVVNNTEVIPGRLFGRKETGGKIEVLILDYAGGIERLAKNKAFISDCMVRSSKPPRPGAMIYFEEDINAEVLNSKNGICSLKFFCNKDLKSKLYKIGKIPLPPYIKRNQEHLVCDDRSSYQTVYAKNKGAIAAPTAGLHFSRSLLKNLKLAGITMLEITLHVGYGTFVPVRVSDIREHKMHSEYCSISQDTAYAINNAKKNGKRIIAVGTTAVRTLEYFSDKKGRVMAASGNCNLFIYPGYKFKVIDAMITNFHLPESTLLMLVSAFAGRELILKAYNEAIQKKYRFYSYGDGMLIV